MGTQKISLTDRYDLEKSPVLLNGTQALVRLTMMQAARDKAAGLNTAGGGSLWRCDAAREYGGLVRERWCSDGHGG